MVWTQFIDFTPDEEDLLDTIIADLGYIRAEDLAAARDVPLNDETAGETGTQQAKHHWPTEIL